VLKIEARIEVVSRGMPWNEHVIDGSVNDSIEILDHRKCRHAKGENEYLNVLSFVFVIGGESFPVPYPLHSNLRTL